MQEQSDSKPPAVPEPSTDPDGTSSQAAPETSRSAGPRKRRRWLRWLANLMIIGGILCIPGYFLGSCGYTWLQQRELLESLEEVSPQITVSLASLSEEDFIPIEIRAENAVAASSPATDGSASAVEPQDEEEARLAALAAAEAQHDLHLALFRAAADRFEADVGGKTGEPIGRIVIPSIGVDVVLLEGTSTSDLKEGPGHWEETPFPGQGGNFVVSGHRTTYGAPFYKLNELQVGEEIDVVLPYVIARYQVTEVFVVYPDEVETVGQRGMEQISLAACHPIYSAKQRIVAKGDLTSFILTEAGT